MHRQTTGASAPFSYTTTSSDNLIDGVFGFDSTLGTGTYPSTVSPTVQDGYWVALDAFAPGTTHTLHFGGMVDFDPGNAGGEMSQDITYTLTVVPEPVGIGAIAIGAIAMMRRRRGR